MATILIPNRFYAPSEYFLYPGDRVFARNPGHSGADFHEFVVDERPSRCRCPARSSFGPLRRRRDVHTALRDAILGEPASLRRSFNRRCDGDEDDILGFPSEYVHLIERLTSGLGGERQRQGPPERNQGAGKKNELSSCCKEAGKANNEGCPAAENGSEKEQPSTPSSSSTTKNQPASSSGEVAKAREPEKADNPFSLSIKIGDYRPEHVKVSVDGRRVIVKAKRDQGDDGGRWVGHSEVEYSFLVPENTPTDNLTSSFGVDGLLSITAATPTRKGEEIPAAVEMKESPTEQTTEVTSESAAADNEEPDTDMIVEEEKENKQAVALDVGVDDEAIDVGEESPKEDASKEG